MPHRVRPRVLETTTTTGTGPLTLAGAVVGFDSFATIGNGNTTFYFIEGLAGSAINDWEEGLGTYDSGVLTRTEVLASSNGGAAVDWGAGTKLVGVGEPAMRSLWNLGAGLVTHDGAGQLSVTSIGVAAGNVLGADSIGFDFSDTEVRRPKLRDTSETKQTVAAAATTNIDIEAGNVVELTQNTNITTFNFNNPPASGTFGTLTIIRVKDNSGTTRSIAWPASVDWPGGTAPDLTQTANAVDIFVFFTIDGGTRWHGAAASLDSK